VIVAFIDSHKRWFGVEPICRVLTEHGMKIAPSTYYAARSRRRSVRAMSDEQLLVVIERVWENNFRCYGVVKMWHALRRDGHQVGRDRIARLMRVAGLSGAVRGRRRTVTTRRDPGAGRHPDLVKRGWDVAEPDTVWVADFTYVWTYQGFCYVSFITDVASRRILGWKASMSKEAVLVTDALQQALATRRRLDSGFTTTGLVHHSDAGSQYTSIALSEQLREAGIAGSIGTVGDALDNALMESTIGLFKTELIHAVGARSWSSRQQVETATAAWVDWFNYRRLHSSIGHQTPVEYETEYHRTRAQEPLAA
jgi:putative transposase